MSTASRVIPRISGASSNTHIKYLLGTLGLSTASLGMYYQSCASEERAYLEKANKKLSAQKKPTTINGENVMYYPWVRDPTKDHEFELVKMRGYFKEGRFMVQKERDGRRGYLVFAPFITRHEGPG